MCGNLPAIDWGTCHIDRWRASLGGVFGPGQFLQVKVTKGVSDV